MGFARAYGYWSDQHAALLYSCAGQVLSCYARRNLVEPDDLVSEAWLRALQNRPPNRLRGCAKYVKQIMHDIVQQQITGQSRWDRKHTPATIGSITPALSFEESELNPSEYDWRQQAIDDANDYSRVRWGPAQLVIELMDADGLSLRRACRKAQVDYLKMLYYLRRVFRPVVSGMHRRSK